MTSSVECLRFAFELDREIAAIRLGDEQAQFRAEPARIAFHVRVARIKSASASSSWRDVSVRLVPGGAL